MCVWGWGGVLEVGKESVLEGKELPGSVCNIICLRRLLGPDWIVARGFAILKHSGKNHVSERSPVSASFRVKRLPSSTPLPLHATLQGVKFSMASPEGARVEETTLRGAQQVTHVGTLRQGTSDTRFLTLGHLHRLSLYLRRCGDCSQQIAGPHTFLCHGEASGWEIKVPKAGSGYLPHSPTSLSLIHFSLSDPGLEKYIKSGMLSRISVSSHLGNSLIGPASLPKFWKDLLLSHKATLSIAASSIYKIKNP